MQKAVTANAELRKEKEDLEQVDKKLEAEFRASIDSNSDKVNRFTKVISD